jgi:hypothetical protein
MANYEFQEDLIVGENGEDIIIRELEKMGATFIDDNKTYEYDIKMLTPNGVRTYEVKTDVYCYPFDDSYNMFVEFECSGRPSGIAKTKADYFVTTFYHLKETWYIETNKLKEIIKESKPPIHTTGGDNGTVKGYLLPRYQHIDEFIVKKLKKMPETKLTIELVPTTCWFSNVRTLLPKAEWDKLRKESYAKAKYKCEICGDVGTNQGVKHAVECHEIWEYDDKEFVQKLNGLISLCPHCHMVKHMGRTTVIGKQDIAIKHLQEVNGWSHKKTVSYLADVYEIHEERSKRKWKLDIEILSENYGIDKKLITEAQNQRL